MIPAHTVNRDSHRKPPSGEELQLLHVDEHLALVVAAGSADAVGHLGLAAAGAGGEVHDMHVVVRPAASAPGLRELALGIRHTFSSEAPSAPLNEAGSLAEGGAYCKRKSRREGGREGPPRRLPRTPTRACFPATGGTWRARPGPRRPESSPG